MSDTPDNNSSAQGMSILPDDFLDDIGQGIRAGAKAGEAVCHDLMEGYKGGSTIDVAFWAENRASQNSISTAATEALAWKAITDQPMSVSYRTYLSACHDAINSGLFASLTAGKIHARSDAETAASEKLDRMTGDGSELGDWLAKIQKAAALQPLSEVAM